MKSGIDISKWQGDVDFVKVKAGGVEFVILREGYRKAVDPMFYEYVDGARLAGLPVVGVYHFSYATSVGDAIDEAKACLKHVETAGLGKDVIIFYDFEYDTVEKAKVAGVKLGKAECVAFSEAFCGYVTEQGYTAGIYSNMDYYKRMYEPWVVDKYKFWLADYKGEPDRPCDFQQYSSTGKVAGISGNVDMDRWYDEAGSTDPVDRVIAIARGEVGYLEKKSNKDLDDKEANAGRNNYTKYARDVCPKLQACAWCDMFVDWCFFKAFGEELAKEMTYQTAGFAQYTPTSSSYYKSNGAWFDAPQVGDQIFFKNDVRIYHTGLVVGVDATTVYTIEGNTSSGAEVIENGGSVRAKSYSLTNPKIAGYGRPKWSLAKPIVEGWVKEADGRWWWQNADGSYPANEWRLIDHHWFLFDADGWMLTGWQKWDGKNVGEGDWYYLNESKNETEGQCWHEAPGGKGALEPWYVE